MNRTTGDDFLMDTNDLIRMDLKHFWHPCTQMKDYDEFPPLVVERAQGSRIDLADGRSLIDGISSWWCKSLGHGHPRVKQAFLSQVERFEHVIMANCSTEVVARLCDELAQIEPTLSRVFLAENGSVSVEIAMKMSLQANAQSGRPQRTGFMALEHAYHGETMLTLATGDNDFFSGPFQHLLVQIPKITGVPYTNGEEPEFSSPVTDAEWLPIEQQLNAHADTLSAILVEPVLQGAGGMRIYKPDFLRRLRDWTTKHQVHLIADEIFTGFGRTGRMMACQYAGIVPDFVTFSKGMTSGFAPLAAVVTTEDIYQSFYADYLAGRTFVHSTTYAGYAPAAAAALEVIHIFREEQVLKHVRMRAPALLQRMKQVAAASSGALVNVRGIGFLAAVDIVNPNTGIPFPREKRAGFQFYKNAARRGALLRPVGDSFYFMPPLNTEDADLDELAGIASLAVKDTIQELCKR